LNKTQEEMVLDNMGLVHKIVGKYNVYDNVNFDYDDLLQEGTIGLMKAIKNFDSSKNNKFSTFAHHYINGYILRHINEVNPIHIPAGKVAKSKRVKKLMQENLSNEKISKELKLNDEKLNDLIDIQNQSVISLYAKTSNAIENNSYYIDTIESKEIADDDLIIDIKNAINKLSKSQKEILMQIIYKNKKGTEIAKEMNYTKQNVNRIYRDALKKLKEELKEGYCFN
jgi:RNA polymerase sigma factor (sigma-70 family)